MSPQESYKHCIRCGGPLVSQQDFLQCSNCNFKQYLNPIPCNSVIVENNKGEIILVRRKFDPQKGYWDLPGGFIDINESLEQSAIREVSEELHVQIEVTNIISVYADTYLFQEIKRPTLNCIVSAKIISGTLESADDIDGYQYFSKDTILSQKIAFPSVKKGIEDYLKRVK